MIHGTSKIKQRYLQTLSKESPTDNWKLRVTSLRKLSIKSPYEKIK